MSLDMGELEGKSFYLSNFLLDLGSEQCNWKHM